MGLPAAVPRLHKPQPELLAHARRRGSRRPAALQPPADGLGSGVQQALAHTGGGSLRVSLRTDGRRNVGADGRPMIDHEGTGWTSGFGIDESCRCAGACSSSPFRRAVSCRSPRSGPARRDPLDREQAPPMAARRTPTGVTWALVAEAGVIVERPDRPTSTSSRPSARRSRTGIRRADLSRLDGRLGPTPDDLTPVSNCRRSAGKTPRSMVSSARRLRGALQRRKLPFPEANLERPG